MCVALMATPRGRWFLQEYANRNRASDTAEVLVAIERMGAVIAGDRAQQSHQKVRIELLEMARTIARTRAEVANTDPGPPSSGTPDEATAEAGAPDISRAAARLRDIAWTMRTCGVELSTSAQIEQIAETILSASSLGEPGDHRAQKLGEVLHYLEHRIDRMLDGQMEAAAGDVAAVPDEPAPPSNGRDHDGEAETPAAPPADVGLASTADTPSADAAPVSSDSSSTGHTAIPFTVDHLLSSELTEPLPAATSSVSGPDLQQPDESKPRAAVPEADAVVQLAAALVAAAATDAIAMQVEEDLRALADSPANTASRLADNATATPAPPPERRGVLSNIWQRAIQTPAVQAVVAAIPGDNRPDPSMWGWLASASARSQSTDGSIELRALLMPELLPKAEPDPQAEIDDELFAGPIGAPMRASAIAAAPIPAAGLLATPAVPSVASPAPAPGMLPAVVSPARMPLKPMPRHGADDPLAALMTMTDEERIALFT